MRLFSFLVFLIYCCCNPIYAKEYSAGWVLWYPYQYHDKSGALVGADIQAFNLIMQTASVKYSLAEIPWKTQLNFVKTGKVDMAMGAYWSEERCKFAYYSRPYRKGLIKLFVKAGQAKNIKLNQLEDLANSPYRLGIERDYFYGKTFEKLRENLIFDSHITEVIDMEDNVALLVSGEVDGFFAEPITVEAFLKKYKMTGDFEMHPVEIYSADVHIMLSKKSTSLGLLNRVNDAILTLQQQGKLALPTMAKTKNKLDKSCQS